MKKNILLSTLFLLFTFSHFAYSQVDKGYYFYVQLTDKNNSPYSLSNPTEYLSQRSIDRRAYFSIPVDSLDLPINPSYTDSIRKLGFHVHCQSKWLNGITVLTKDSLDIDKLNNISFVRWTQFTGITTENGVNYISSPKKIKNVDYGSSENQIKELNGDYLHNQGFFGEDIHIAVIDAGFYGVNTNPAFASLRNEGRLLGTKDFVNPVSNIYAQDSHGSNVLSTMAGKKDDGTYLGSAPKASYWLLRTEAAVDEYLCEPDFWVSAIEYADSVGVDLSTTSLGYFEFDDTNMNYTHADLDGTTARVSIAANIAAQKGIMLLNSAGNEGNNSWKKISFPADAEDIITVGAVRADSVMAVFSSYGYSADGRVKPELCARGQATVMLNSTGNIFSGNGTSYSTPLLAGLTACYLQAAKSKRNSFTLKELRENMYESAHQYNAPTTQGGYGIPDFEKALVALDNTGTNPVTEDNFEVILKPNIGLFVRMNNTTETAYTVSVYGITGRMLLTKQTTQNETLLDVEHYPKGVYLLVLATKSGKINSKLFVK